MKNIVQLLFFIILIAGCRSTPTVIKEEVGGALDNSLVIVDTRNSLHFLSFHIPGSVNLYSEDFIIIKNAKQKTRKLDPDLAQNIERLAKKGISPFKNIILISDKVDSVENKKWQWLLKRLDVINVELTSLDAYKEKNKPLRPKPNPERSPTWKASNTQEIREKSDQCFVNWNEEFCK